MKCTDFGLLPCYDCRRVAEFTKPYDGEDHDERCYLNRVSAELNKATVEQLKATYINYLRRHKYMPKGALNRYEKAIEIHRPELFEWHEKIKVLM